MRDPDWDIAEGLDPEGPSAADLDRFGDEMVTCPECGSDIYDQAEICPNCGRLLSGPEKKLPLWTIAVAVLTIAMLLIWLA